MTASLPFDTATQTWLQCAARGIDWLVPQLDSAGRLPSPLHDLGSYYKWPLALLSSGRTALARRLFEIIVDDFMTDDGDFRTGAAKCGDPLYGLIADTYTNTWPIVAARALERPDVGERGLDCLRQRHHALTGGYLTGYPGQHDDQRQDIVTIAGCGNALLAWDYHEEAAGAGDCLLHVLSLQSGPGDPFYLYIDGQGQLLTELDIPHTLYRICPQEPGQVYVYWGMAAVFLARLYLVTGQDRFLTAARQYFARHDACGDRVFEGIGCCKTGWSAAVLFRITGEAPYRHVVERAAAEILRAQSALGDWPRPEQSKVLATDCVGELVYHLTQYALELSAAGAPGSSPDPYMSPRELRILSPTAILGYGFPAESFERGLARDPHLIAVDAGSTDPGPYYLGVGESFTDRTAVGRDLTLLLEAALSRHIPLIVGTAGGCGAAPHLAWCREIVEEIARDRGLTFRLGVITADVETEVILNALSSGHIEPAGGAPDLTEEAVVASTRIVAQMGVEPIIAALDADCDVILAGRTYDPAVFAALPIREGFDRGLALHLGKILECAAIAATPGSGADCALGILRDDSFILEATSEERSFTRESTAAHTLYEKSDPYHLAGPGGVLNLECCEITELGDGRVEVKGSRYESDEQFAVMLEGARCVGFRTVCIAGIRDPTAIDRIDAILGAARGQVEDMLEERAISGDLHFHVYGRDGVMGALERVRDAKPHELGLVLEAVAPTQLEADTVCSLMRSTLLHLGYPNRITTAGNLAFPFSPSDVPMGPVYEFSIHHLMRTEPCALFPLTLHEIPVRRST